MQHYIENRQPAIRSTFWWQQCLRTSCQSFSKTPKNICRSGTTDLLTWGPMMARHFQRKLGEEEKARGKEKIRPSFWLRLPSVALRSQPCPDRRKREPTRNLLCPVLNRSSSYLFTCCVYDHLLEWLAYDSQPFSAGNMIFIIIIIMIIVVIIFLQWHCSHHDDEHTSW